MTETIPLDEEIIGDDVYISPQVVEQLQHDQPEHSLLTRRGWMVLGSVGVASATAGLLASLYKVRHAA